MKRYVTKAELLSLQTNERRKLAEAKRTQQQEAEKKRYEEALAERRARQRYATEKYQRMPVRRFSPITDRRPGSSTTLIQSKSSEVETSQVPYKKDIAQRPHTVNTSTITPHLRKTQYSSPSQHHYVFYPSQQIDQTNDDNQVNLSRSRDLFMKTLMKHEERRKMLFEKQSKLAEEVNTAIHKNEVKDLPSELSMSNDSLDLEEEAPMMNHVPSSVPSPETLYHNYRVNSVIPRLQGNIDVGKTGSTTSKLRHDYYNMMPNSPVNRVHSPINGQISQQSMMIQGNRVPSPVCNEQNADMTSQQYFEQARTNSAMYFKPTSGKLTSTGETCQYDGLNVVENIASVVYPVSSPVYQPSSAYSNIAFMSKDDKPHSPYLSFSEESVLHESQVQDRLHRKNNSVSPADDDKTSPDEKDFPNLHSLYGTAISVDRQGSSQSRRNVPTETKYMTYDSDKQNYITSAPMYTPAPTPIKSAPMYTPAPIKSIQQMALQQIPHSEVQFAHFHQQNMKQTELQQALNQQSSLQHALDQQASHTSNQQLSNHQMLNSQPLNHFPNQHTMTQQIPSQQSVQQLPAQQSGSHIHPSKKVSVDLHSAPSITEATQTPSVNQISSFQAWQLGHHYSEESIENAQNKSAHDMMENYISQIVCPISENSTPENIINTDKQNPPLVVIPQLRQSSLITVANIPSASRLDSNISVNSTAKISHTVQSTSVIIDRDTRVLKPFSETVIPTQNQPQHAHPPEKTKPTPSNHAVQSKSDVSNASSKIPIPQNKAVQQKKKPLRGILRKTLDAGYKNAVINQNLRAKKAINYSDLHENFDMKDIKSERRVRFADGDEPDQKTTSDEAPIKNDAAYQTGTTLHGKQVAMVSPQIRVSDTESETTEYPTSTISTEFSESLSQHDISTASSGTIVNHTNVVSTISSANTSSNAYITHNTNITSNATNNTNTTANANTTNDTYTMANTHTTVKSTNDPSNNHMNLITAKPPTGIENRLQTKNKGHVTHVHVSPQTKVCTGINGKTYQEIHKTRKLLSANMKNANETLKSNRKVDNDSNSNLQLGNSEVIIQQMNTYNDIQRNEYQRNAEIQAIQQSNQSQQQKMINEYNQYARSEKISGSTGHTYYPNNPPIHIPEPPQQMNNQNYDDRQHYTNYPNNQIYDSLGQVTNVYAMNYPNNIRLDKTPTDDEINTLWSSVRTCLSRNASDSDLYRSTQEHHYVVPNRKNVTFQTPVTKVTMNDIRGSRSQSAGSRSNLLQRQQRVPTSFVAQKCPGSPQKRGPGPKQQRQAWSKEGEVTESLAGFLAAEQLCQQGASESMMERGMDQAALIQAQFNNNHIAQYADHTALSIEEARLLESISRLDSQLKLTEIKLEPTAPECAPTAFSGFRGHRPLSAGRIPLTTTHRPQSSHPVHRKW